MSVLYKQTAKRERERKRVLERESERDQRLCPEISAVPERFLYFFIFLCIFHSPEISFLAFFVILLL